MMFAAFLFVLAVLDLLAYGRISVVMMLWDWIMK